MFHAGSAPGVRPSEPCSSRAAVCRYRHRSPPDVRSARGDPHGRSPAKSQIPRICASARQRPVVRTSGHPPPSGCITARESATRVGGLDQPGHVALLGLCPLQGTPPARMIRPSPASPLMRLAESGANDRHHSTPGSHFQRDGLASLEAADPPGVCRLERSRLFGKTAIRESPPRAPGCVAAPCRTVLESLPLPCRSQP